MSVQTVQDKSGQIKNVLIDKSKVEIAALNSMGIKYLLCLFHVLQDWERFLRSAESGVKGDDNRAAVLARLKKMALVEDAALFAAEMKGFKSWCVALHRAVLDHRNDCFVYVQHTQNKLYLWYSSIHSWGGIAQRHHAGTMLSLLSRQCFCVAAGMSSVCLCRLSDQGYTEVLEHFEKNWEKDIQEWAFFGRKHLLALGINTNNHLERWFGIFKLIFMHGRKFTCLHELVLLLVEQVMPFYLQDRLKKLACLKQSGGRLECGLGMNQGIHAAAIVGTWDMVGLVSSDHRRV